jgi:peptide/nickel transport system substrate-binding protein
MTVTSRRTFLRLALTGSSISLMAACGQAASTPAAAPTTAASAPTQAAPPAAPTQVAAATAAPTPAAAAAAVAKPGEKVVSIAIQVKPTGFYTLQFIAQQISALFFDKLLTVSDDWGLQPRLAEKWEMGPDAKSVTFHLRKGLKWSDGAPLTAKDIHFTFKSTMDSRTAALPGPTSIITGYADFRAGKIDSPPGLVVVDDTTFRIDFDTPNAGFVPSISFLGFQILPEHILGSVDPKELQKHPFFQSPTVASGPFKFVRYQTDQFIEVERNPNFWGPAPKVDRIFVRTVTSDVATAQLEKGEIQHTQISATDAARLAKTPGIKVANKPGAGIILMAAAVDQPKLKDKRVRQAMLYAIDRENIVKQVLNGYGRVVNCHIIGPDWAVNPDLNTYGYNPAKAQALLKEANWDPATSVKIQWIQGGRDLDNALQIVQAQLQAVGIKAELNPLERGPILENIQKRTFDLSAYGGGVYTVDPDSTSYVLMCQFGQPKGANNSDYCNPDVDKLFLAGRAATNQADRAKAYKDAAKLINDDVSHIWLFVQDAIWAYSDKLQGLKPHGDTNSAYWNAEEWSI